MSSDDASRPSAARRLLVSVPDVGDDNSTGTGEQPERLAFLGREGLDGDSERAPRRPLGKYAVAIATGALGRLTIRRYVSFFVRRAYTRIALGLMVHARVLRAVVVDHGRPTCASRSISAGVVKLDQSIAQPLGISQHILAPR